MNWPNCRPSNCWKAIARAVHAARRHRGRDLSARTDQRLLQCRLPPALRYRPAPPPSRATLGLVLRTIAGQIDRRARQHQGSAVYVAGVRGAGRRATPTRIWCRIVDAAAVSASKSAGAIVTCKTTTCESGYKLHRRQPGVRRHPQPWKLRSDQRRIQRRRRGVGRRRMRPARDRHRWRRLDPCPSAFCGVVGIKPTFGLVPRSPGFFAAVVGVAGPYRPDRAHGSRRRTSSRSGCDHDLRDAASLPVPASGTSTRRRNGSTGSGSAAAPISAMPRRRRRSQGISVGGRDARFDSAPSIVPDCAHFEPDMLERILKPIAYTEQAAAVSARGALRLMSLRQRVPRCGGEGRSYSGIEYVEAGYRRNSLRMSFLEIFGRSMRSSRRRLRLRRLRPAPRR